MNGKLPIDRLGSSGVTAGMTLIFDGQRWRAQVNGHPGFGTNSVVVGADAGAIGSLGVAVGYSADADGNDATAIGGNAQALGLYSTALGAYAGADDTGATALGYSATSGAARSIAVGSVSFSSGTDSIVVGADSVAQTNRARAIVLGTNHTSTASDRCDIKANDLELTRSSTGTGTSLILRDTATGTRYRVQVTNGALSVTPA